MPARLSGTNRHGSIGSAVPSRPICVSNNPGLEGADDLRDLWNQQTPFAIDEKLRPLFLQRLKDSLANWDMRDGKQDWTPSALAANANMFLDDFLLFDVAKPITDTSHLEIEKSTLNGKAYQTGGGRTVDADVIDVLLTWMVNRDREFLEGGTTKATKPGTKNFPYFATPNTELQTVAETVELDAAPDKVWELIGQFGGSWHPLIANIELTGTGVGQLRVIETIDGKQIIERLDAIDNAGRFYRYTNIAGFPVSNYTGMLAVKPNGAGSSVEWRCAVSSERPGHACREDDRLDAVQDRARKPQVALLRCYRP